MHYSNSKFILVCVMKGNKTKHVHNKNILIVVAVFLKKSIFRSNIIHSGSESLFTVYAPTLDYS